MFNRADRVSAINVLVDNELNMEDKAIYTSSV